MRSACEPHADSSPFQAGLTLTGKDGRPLSPLSAAMARAKAGEDPFAEEEAHLALRPTQFEKCPSCGRQFAAARVQQHLAICQKAKANAKQRGVWDSHASRVDRDEEARARPPSP